MNIFLHHYNDSFQYIGWSRRINLCCIMLNLFNLTDLDNWSFNLSKYIFLQPFWYPFCYHKCLEIYNKHYFLCKWVLFQIQISMRFLCLYNNTNIIEMLGHQTLNLHWNIIENQKDSLKWITADTELSSTMNHKCTIHQDNTRKIFYLRID